MPVLPSAAGPRRSYLPTRERLPALNTAALLAGAPIDVMGRVPGASNAVFRAVARVEGGSGVGGDVGGRGGGTGEGARAGEGDRAGEGARAGDLDQRIECAYKPAAGERPLWDFPGMILARHEVAAYQVSQALGMDVVPPTVWREDLDHGPGAVQAWVASGTTSEVEVFEIGEVPAGWLTVMSGEDGLGRQVVVAHRDTPRLADIALFDVVINNSDRKAGHLLGDGARVMGIDHGVAFHHEWKLRTVLWGFAGRSLTAAQMDVLVALRNEVGDGLPLEGVGLQARAALLRRVHDLLETGEYPAPRPGWPVVPWPLW